MKKTFTILSLGQRGVGKTVFLAGSWLEMGGKRSHTQPLWFDCHDDETLERLEKLVAYMRSTGQYPPATPSISQFAFSLKRGGRTLCHFRWQDVPGEICHRDHPSCRQLALASQGCCVFLDATALLTEPDYQERLAEIYDQVYSLAYLTGLNRMEYPFALVLTKCDLLGTGDLQNRLESAIAPLTDNLRRMGATWQMFRSSVAFTTGRGSGEIAATSAAPLLWLVSEISRTHRGGWFAELRSWLGGLVDRSATEAVEAGTLARLFPAPPQKNLPDRVRSRS